MRKRPVLLRANFLLTKDRKRSYYGHFCGKIYREGLSGTGDSQRDSRESIRANRLAIETLIFIVRQADLHESLEFPIRANHATKGRGLVVKRPGALSKVPMLNLVFVLGVGVFSLLPKSDIQGLARSVSAVVSSKIPLQHK